MALNGTPFSKRRPTQINNLKYIKPDHLVLDIPPASSNYHPVSTYNVAYTDQFSPCLTTGLSTQPSTASTATFEITDPFPRPQRHHQRTTTHKSSSSSLRRPVERLPVVPTAFAVQQHVQLLSPKSSSSSSTAPSSYGFPYRSSILVTSTSNEQLRSRQIDDRDYHPYNAGLIVKDVEEDRRSSSDVDFDLSIDNSSHDHHDEEGRREDDMTLQRQQAEYTLNGSRRSYDSGLSPQALDYGVDTRREDVGLRQAYQRGEKEVTTTMYDSQRARNYGRDDVVVYNPMDSVHSTYAQHDIIDPAWRYQASRGGGGGGARQLNYYDDDSRAFENVSLAEQQSAAEEETRRLRKKKRLSWATSSSSNNPLSYLKDGGRIHSPLLSPLSDDYTSDGTFTSLSLLHDTPSTPTTEDDFLMDMVGSPRSRMQFAKSKLNHHHHPQPSSSSGTSERRELGLGLDLGSNEEYDGSTGSKPFHRELRLSYSNVRPIVSPPPSAASMRTRHFTEPVSPRSSNITSPSARRELRQSVPDTVIDIVAQSATASEPVRPRHFPPTSIVSSRISQERQSEVRAPRFGFVPAPLKLVPSLSRHRRSTTVLSVPRPRRQKQDQQRQQQDRARSRLSFPPLTTSPLVAPSPIMASDATATQQHLPRPRRKRFTYSSLFFWNGSVDDIIPAKLCFILGFFIGPWAWLLGGFMLDERNGELLRTIGKRCRLGMKSSVAAGAGAGAKGGELTGMTGCGCGQMMKHSHPPRIGGSSLGVESATAGEGDGIEKWKGVEKWVMINRIAAGASSTISFPLVGWAIWAAVTA